MWELTGKQGLGLYSWIIVGDVSTTSYLAHRDVFTDNCMRMLTMHTYLLVQTTDIWGLEMTMF